MTLLKNPIFLVLLFIVFITGQSSAENIDSSELSSFGTGVSYNDVFVTFKVIENLQTLKVPFYVNNEGIIYVENKNEKIINVNNPTKGLGLTQFPELSKATLFMVLLSEKGIEYFPAKSGDNNYFNLYYSNKDQEQISQEIMPLFLKALDSGILINYQ